MPDAGVLADVVAIRVAGVVAGATGVAVGVVEVELEVEVMATGEADSKASASLLLVADGRVSPFVANKASTCKTKFNMV